MRRITSSQADGEYWCSRGDLIGMEHTLIIAAHTIEAHSFDFAV